MCSRVYNAWLNVLQLLVLYNTEVRVQKVFRREELWLKFWENVEWLLTSCCSTNACFLLLLSIFRIVISRRNTTRTSSSCDLNYHLILIERAYTHPGTPHPFFNSLRILERVLCFFEKIKDAERFLISRHLPPFLPHPSPILACLK